MLYSIIWDFRCFLRFPRKNTKHRLHFESFVPHFRPNLPTSRRSLSHPNVLRIQTAFLHHFTLVVSSEFCDAGDLQARKSVDSMICWLIPLFINSFVKRWHSVIHIWARRSWCLNGESSETRWEKTSRTWRFLEMSSNIVHGPRDLDCLKTTFEKMMWPFWKMTCFLLEEAPKLPESESIIYLNWSSEFWKQTTTCFVDMDPSYEGWLGDAPHALLQSWVLGGASGDDHGKGEDRIITNSKWQIFEKISSFDFDILIFIEECTLFFRYFIGLKVSESLNLSLWIDDLEPWDHIKHSNLKSKICVACVGLCVYIF